jgi:predicted hydrocarbon binding protein
MHNTGHVTLERTPEGARVAVVGYGAPCPAMCATLQGWVAETTELAGGQEVDAREVECRQRGDASCVYQVHWSPADRG